MSKIAIACDHAGFELKQLIVSELIRINYKPIDFGTENSITSVDYPDYAKLVCNCLVEGVARYGILICGSGIGMSIAANRLSAIRAALCLNVDMAFTAKAHNNANVLVMASRLTPFEQAKEIIAKFLLTKFEGGRHVNRIAKMS
jgi:ribose 5-phosphate isomerase B